MVSFIFVKFIWLLDKIYHFMGWNAGSQGGFTSYRHVLFFMKIHR